MGNVMRDALDTRLITDGGSAELCSFMTRGFCLMMTSLLSLLSSHESSEMPMPFPTPPSAFEIHPPGGRKERRGWVGG